MPYTFVGATIEPDSGFGLVPTYTITLLVPPADQDLLVAGILWSSIGALATVDDTGTGFNGNTAQVSSVAPGFYYGSQIWATGNPTSWVFAAVGNTFRPAYGYVAVYRQAAAVDFAAAATGTEVTQNGVGAVANTLHVCTWAASGATIPTVDPPLTSRFVTPSANFGTLYLCLGDEELFTTTVPSQTLGNVDGTGERSATSTYGIAVGGATSGFGFEDSAPAFMSL